MSGRCSRRCREAALRVERSRGLTVVEVQQTAEVLATPHRATAGLTPLFMTHFSNLSFTAYWWPSNHNVGFSVDYQPENLNWGSDWDSFALGGSYDWQLLPWDQNVKFR